MARAFHLAVAASSVAACVAPCGCATERLDATYWLETQAGSGSGGASTDATTDVRAPTGYLRVSGSKILDSTGRQVRLTGITWHGLETDTFSPAGLWARPLPELMSQIRALSYNSIRFTLSFRLLDPDALSKGAHAQLNPGLEGLTGLQMLDRLVDEAEKNQLRVILCQQSWSPGVEEELWYDAAHGEDQWIERWRTLATRYRGRPAVIGFELHNAPRNIGAIAPTWGDGGPVDWWAAAKRAGNAVLAANPDLLVFVDGVQEVGAEGYWWGGNLLGAEVKPIALDVPNRVVYATHEYPRTVFDQPWFAPEANYFEKLPPVWGHFWGYLVERDIAPVWMAEFGTATELPWLQQILDYATSRNVHFAYRAFNPNTDTRIGGILRDDWQTVNEEKQSRLAPALAPIIP